MTDEEKMTQDKLMGLVPNPSREEVRIEKELDYYWINQREGQSLLEHATEAASVIYK
jgi:hypothetical protein